MVNSGLRLRFFTSNLFSAFVPPLLSLSGLLLTYLSSTGEKNLNAGVKIKRVFLKRRVADFLIEKKS